MARLVGSGWLAPAAASPEEMPSGGPAEPVGAGAGQSGAQDGLGRLDTDARGAEDRAARGLRACERAWRGGDRCLPARLS